MASYEHFWCDVACSPDGFVSQCPVICHCLRMNCVKWRKSAAIKNNLFSGSVYIFMLNSCNKIKLKFAAYMIVLIIHVVYDRPYDVRTFTYRPRLFTCVRIRLLIGRLHESIVLLKAANVGHVVDTRYGGYQPMTESRLPQDHNGLCRMVGGSDIHNTDFAMLSSIIILFLMLGS